MSASAPIETKVKASMSTALVAAFITGWIVTTIPGLEGAAEPVQAGVIALITSAAAGAAGWLAKHTPRRDARDGSYGR